ncbi:hypothetical protein SMD11_3978 [Streptomyces albireticuli]|uniref:Uncharacterized protein n=1 Tax=Streptomyces albireticuli TaxID=1940 RepID=A0A1Z2L5L8_9ACTN|nr:hypothetical protein [Streptomyces albireticuli]ARZ69593.1 hypothetical protein SMD11_3978 [Streptomyces albireticuli]
MNRLRKPAALAVAAAALLTVGPLTAQAVAAEGPRVRAATSGVSRAEARVDAFLQEYRRATLGAGDRTPAQVRARFLAPELNERLDGWARLHGADPVFRAQDAPSSWSLRYEGSGAGHSTVVVTERWPSGATADIWYSVRLSDLTVNDLKGPPE